MKKSLIVISVVVIYVMLSAVFFSSATETDVYTDENCQKSESVQSKEYEEPVSSNEQEKGTTGSDMPSDKGISDAGNGLTESSKSVASSNVIASARPAAKINVNVSYQNNKAIISWNMVKGASYYLVYRKAQGEKKWTRIAKRKRVSYKDYFKRLKKSKQRALLRVKKYIDPTENSLRYKVVAKNRKGKQISCNGLNGNCNIIRPVVLSAEVADSYTTLSWAKVPNAYGYIIYGGNKNDGQIKWTKLRTVSVQSKRVHKGTVSNEYSYYGVAARYKSNGKTVTSSYEKGFTVSNKSHREDKIVCIGDSVAFGTPYRNEDKKLFTFMRRIHELTGSHTANKSLPGATFAVRKHSNKMVKVAKQTDFKQYDVVIISCGSNDFAKNSKLGSKNDKNVHTFNGAVNTIMSRIKAASAARVKAGEDRIKVIFVDMYYSSLRTGKKNSRHIKFSTYQKNLNYAVDKYNSSVLKVYRMPNKQIVNKKNAKYTSVDNLHMTKNVYAEMGTYLSNLMIKNNML